MGQRSPRDVPSFVLFETLVDVPSSRTDPQEIQTQVDVPSTCTTMDVPSNVLRQRSQAVKPLILCEWGYKRILRREREESKEFSDCVVLNSLTNEKGDTKEFRRLVLRSFGKGRRETQKEFRRAIFLLPFVFKPPTRKNHNLGTNMSHHSSSVNGEGSSHRDPLSRILDELSYLKLWKEKQEIKEKGKKRVEEISQDERKKIREEERRKIMKEMKREKHASYSSHNSCKSLSEELRDYYEGMHRSHLRPHSHRREKERKLQEANINLSYFHGKDNTLATIATPLGLEFIPQVKKFLDEGLVRKSLNSCALLVPKIGIIRHQVPKMDGMMNVLSGATLFCKTTRAPNIFMVCVHRDPLGSFNTNLGTHMGHLRFVILFGRNNQYENTEKDVEGRSPKYEEPRDLRSNPFQGGGNDAILPCKGIG
ncbi:hypothetical protein HKD37_06G016588 [Glycine soja]